MIVDRDGATAPVAAEPPHEFSGVYVAKPQRMLVGPLLHLRSFLHLPRGASFGTAVLPAVTSRYVVDCSRHTADVPPLPGYAVTAASGRRGSAATSSSPTTPTARRPPASADTDPLRSPPSPAAIRPTPVTPARHADPLLLPAAAPLSLTAPSSREVGQLSTEEAVARMNSNAAEFIEKLRVRCEVNGMSMRGLSLSRHVSMVSVPRALMVIGSSSPSPTTEEMCAADRRHHRSSSSSSSSSAGSPLPVAPERQKARSLTRSSRPAAVAPLPGSDAQLTARAQLSDELTRLAEEALGANHVVPCPLPDVAHPLDTPAVQAAVQRMSGIFAGDADALVYVYSHDGKGSASAVAALYLLQVDRVPLSEALTVRLPMCTPRMTCLAQLLRHDPSPSTFDVPAYLHAYLARRYPTASAASIEAAVATCDNESVKAERLLRNDISFQASEGLTSRATVRTGSVMISDALSVSNVSNGGGGGGGAVSGSGTRAGRAASRLSLNSTSDFSLASGGGGAAREWLLLSDGDETIVDSLHSALVEGGVGVSREQVRSSYVHHRRAQDKVLRQFLLRIRPVGPTTSSAMSDGVVTPPINPLEAIALPKFPAMRPSRRKSSATAASGGGSSSSRAAAKAVGAVKSKKGRSAANTPPPPTTTTTTTAPKKKSAAKPSTAKPSAAAPKSKTAAATTTTAPQSKARGK
ncbi:hypothetical protein NESM_000416500 [Novymonas esmeraldas]|uniref:Uncharacterized protein n=1 Tax=Novymonas esmeraldas TaxID=1808958 RepID=A0AAW0EMH3_9TRYP